MNIELYDPFQHPDFSPETCFLTGQKLDGSAEQLSVFPEWLMDRYSLRDQAFKMLDESSLKYQDMKMACTQSLIESAITPLETEIETAFTAGYEAVVQIPEERLFLWMAKMVYGVLYSEISIEQQKHAAKGKEFKVTPFLQVRFQKLHLLLQSLAIPMEFKGPKPWSIQVVKLQISKDVFNYKDDPNNLNFSLSMHDFGIVACLQDNGVVGVNQQELTAKIAGKTLHPVQYQELCAKFIYANYILNKLADYNIETTDQKVIVESIPLTDTPAEPLFDHWDDDLFAQVLAVYWKPWGIPKDEIITTGNSPISFLVNDYTHEFIELASIDLPY